MNFLPDVYVECEVCKGKRYNKETLDVYYKGKNIYDVLEMSVLEAYEFFKNIPTLERKLKVLIDVGLDYIKIRTTCNYSVWWRSTENKTCNRTF